MQAERIPIQRVNSSDESGQKWSEYFKVVIIRGLGLHPDPPMLAYPSVAYPPIVLEDLTS